MTQPVNNTAPHRTGKRLPVMERFYTLQGEGRFSGRAAYFIRLAGCPVRCSWCDVKDSWTARADQYIPVADIAAGIPPQARIAVVTGGEPLLYDLAELTETLHGRGLRTHLETSGARALSGRWDWVCVSPKVVLTPSDDVLAHADELKVVVSGPEDIVRAERCAERTKEGCALLLQPEWSRRHEVLPCLIEYIGQNPRWGLSVQMHKYIGIP